MEGVSDEPPSRYILDANLTPFASVWSENVDADSKLIAAAPELLERLTPIPTSERLPDTNEPPVLAFWRSYGNYFKCGWVYAIYEDGWYERVECLDGSSNHQSIPINEALYAVTHWLPMPDKPTPKETP